MEKAIIVSNNPLVWAKYAKAVKIAGSPWDVLVAARDYIYRGGRLISHPLAGSTKPHETPYRSLILVAYTSHLDYHSLHFIEKAIEVNAKFVSLIRDWPGSVKTDFQLIDAELLESAISALPPDLILERS